MKQTLNIILTAILSVLPLLVSGNGSGVYTISSAARSSDPIFREIKDITLLSEKLTINLNSGYSEVTVKYVLWNNSDNDYNDIDYAFPVDYIWANSSGGPEPEIKRIAFFRNDERLDFARSEDRLLPPGTDSVRTDASSDMDFTDRIYRRWYYTRFSVEKHSAVQVEVQYTLSNLMLCDNGNSPYNLTFFNGCSRRSLTYDFSPAASWGDGIIRDFYVEVNGEDLLLAGDGVGSLVPYPEGGFSSGDEVVSGLDFEREGNRFIYRARNFDLKKARPLYIQYTAAEINSMEVLTRYMIDPQEYSARASRSLPDYPQTNLGDMDLETAWVGKIGDRIEIALKDNYMAYGICIVNGYQRSAETYEQNNRVKKMKIAFEGEDGEFYEAYPMEFEEEPYRPLFFENLFPHRNYFYYDFFDAPESFGKIRLTIEEVYSGTKYDDTCISEIILLGERKH